MILTALKREILNSSLSVEVDSEFKACLKIIALWRESYPVTYNRLEEMLCAAEESVQGLEKALHICDGRALQLFKEVYPVLTSGVSFDTLGGDLVDVVDSVGRALVTKQYRGIVLILDEFNKILDGVARGSVNLKLVQDLAELANRSDKGYVFHLLTTTHRAISQYTSGLSKLAADQWRAVEGRFRIFDISNRPGEIYSLISRVLVKNPENLDALVPEISCMHSFLEHPRLHSVFEGLDTKTIERTIIKGCFPLHPVTAYCLPRVSARVAQNERTLFTFLAGKDDSPLVAVLGRSLQEQPFISPWQIWDYFSYQLERSQDPDVKSIWKTITSAMDNVAVEAGPERIIIKTLGVFMLANNRYNLPLTMNLVKLALMPDLDSSSFDQAVTSLLREKVLFIRRSDNTLCLVEPIGVDVESLVEEWLRNNTLGHPLDLIPKHIGGQYVIPHEYNLFAKMTRYLTPVYCDTENINKVISSHGLSPEFNDCDAVICYLFPRTIQERNELVAHVRTCVESRAVFVLPKEPRPISDLIRRLHSLLELQKEMGPQDKRIEQLLDLYAEDAKRALINGLTFVTSPSNNVEYYYLGRSLESVCSERTLSLAASDIMRNLYRNSPVLNNELINKHLPTQTSRKARNTVLDLLLKKEKEIRKKLPSSQEEFMFDSLLVRPGLYDEGTECIYLENSYASVVLDRLYCELTRERFKPIPIEPIINTLISPPFGIRKGIIPVLFTALLADKLQNYITIQDSTGKDCEVDAGLLDKVVVSPAGHTVTFGHWNSNLEELAMGIAHVFSPKIAKDRVFANRFMDLGDSLFKWFTNLPRYARETSDLSEHGKILRRIARVVTKSPKRVLMSDLPIQLGYNEVDAQAVAEIVSLLGQAKDELEGKLNELTGKVENVMVGALSSLGLKGKNILSVARNLVESTSALPHVPSSKFVSYVSRYKGYDEVQFVHGLASILTGVRLEDWLDVTLDSLRCSMNEIRQAFEEAATTLPTGPRVELTYLDQNDKVFKAVLPELTVSSMGHLLQSELESAINDFGESISMPEKRQILINLLRGLV